MAGLFGKGVFFNFLLKHDVVKGALRAHDALAPVVGKLFHQVAQSDGHRLVVALTEHGYEVPQVLIDVGEVFRNGFTYRTVAVFHVFHEHV